MIRYVHEQIKCEKCGFTNLLRYPAIFNAENHPEIVQRILSGYTYSCKNCGKIYPLGRELTIITQKGDIIIHTSNKKEDIMKEFLLHDVIENPVEE